MKLLLAIAFVASAAAQEATPIYEPGDGVSLPQVTKQVFAQYTSEAMKHRIQGKLVVSAVVLADGTVSDVKVTKSLDLFYGLDDNAVNAVKQWQFKPGKKDGTPVAVRITVAMSFVLAR